MDSRCPRGLTCMPTQWCELSVLRLKAIRNTNKELPESEEAKLPGCPYAINHQLAHYCFFKYLSDFTSDRSISDVELAVMLNVSVETIKKIEKSALTKMRHNSTISGLKGDGDGQVVEDSGHVDYKIYR